MEKELCVSHTWFRKEEDRKVTLRMGENETEVDYVAKERVPTFYSKYEGNLWGVSTCLSDSRCRCEENKGSSKKDMC